MKHALLLLTSLVISFFLLDRALYPAVYYACEKLKEDKLVFNSLVPNKRCRMKSEEFNVEIKMNTLGLRDKEITPSKPEDEYRILFLGDSFTFGWGVELDDTFVKQIQRTLSETFFPLHVRAINAGVPTYSPLLEKLYLENRGMQLEPDMVIVQLFMNDFFDEREYGKKAVRDAAGEIVGVAVQLKPHLPESLTSVFDGRSVVYYAYKRYAGQLSRWRISLVSWMKREMVSKPIERESVFSPGDPDSDQYAIARPIPDELFRELFVPVVERTEAMHRYLTERNIPMVVVLVPAGFQVGPTQASEFREKLQLTDDQRSDRVFVELATYFADRRIPYVDLTPHLRDYMRQHPLSTLYYPKDWHLTNLGHELAGDIITEVLADRIAQP